jgi:hypothetical protein
VSISYVDSLEMTISAGPGKLAAPPFGSLIKQPIDPRPICDRKAGQYPSEKNRHKDDFFTPNDYISEKGSFLS